MAARLAVPALLLLLLASSPAAAAGDKGPEKVAVALYYESLCPYSARFVVDRLARVFEDGLLDAVDLTLVPYGNARVHAGGEISCQVRRASPAQFRSYSRVVVDLFFAWSLGSRFLAVVLGDPRHDWGLLSVC
jgi:hypothetical protein